nr:DUF3991 domain-containing protein [Virgibacillus halodenitrificans]
MKWRDKVYKQEEINKAVAVDIVDYCEKNNIELKSDSERYYRLAAHDSLVIDRRKNSFYWNSKGLGGNTINFIQKVEGKSFKDAMKTLLDQEQKYQDNKSVEYVVEPYEYDYGKQSNSFNKARDYLVQERKIAPEVVDDIHSKGLIKQDRYSNVLFLWKDKDQIMGCSEQGVYKSDKYKRGSWKSVQKNSTANYGFSVPYGQPRNLKFFESSVDLMSYASLHKEKLKDTHLVSMEGLKHNTVFNYMSKAMKELDESPDSVALCVDNDAGGKEFLDKFKFLRLKHNNGSTSSIRSEIPDNPYNQAKWDWNDQCKYLAKKKEQEMEKDKAPYHQFLNKMEKRKNMYAYHKQKQAER